MLTDIPEPLHLARIFGVPMQEVAVRLRVTPDWLRQLARKPRHTHRVRIAELEAILHHEKLVLLAESLMGTNLKTR